MSEEWTKFVRKRLNALHREVFAEQEPSRQNALLYFAYHRELNGDGCGRDYSTHPRNPWKPA